MRSKINSLSTWYAYTSIMESLVAQPKPTLNFTSDHAMIEHEHLNSFIEKFHFLHQC